MPRRKKWERYLPPFEHYEVELYYNVTDWGVGDAAYIVYEEGIFVFKRFYWGADIDYEYDMHGQVEKEYIFNKERTKKLMLRVGARNGKELMDQIVKRFKDKGINVHWEFEKFCKKKGLEYQVYI